MPAAITALDLPPRLMAPLNSLQTHFKYLDEEIGEI